MREQWWRQTAADGQLNITLKEILEAVWDWRRWESDRRGEGKGVEGGEEESGSGSDGRGKGG